MQVFKAALRVVLRHPLYLLVYAAVSYTHLGPTSAFKDMALQCLPRFFSASAQALRERGKLDHEFLILVATSGDTGKAALEGFKDAEGVRIGVLFPDGGVSDIQRKQMVTQTGRNVQVWAVRGNFDDCQTGVKSVDVYKRQPPYGKRPVGG